MHRFYASITRPLKTKLGTNFSKNNINAFSQATVNSNFIREIVNKDFHYIRIGSEIADQKLIDSIYKIKVRSIPTDSRMVNIQTTGQFCSLLTIYDERVTFLITDPTGIRSLFTHINENEISISSSLSLLSKKNNFLNDYSVENLTFYLKYGYLPPGLTIFNKIQEIPANTLNIFFHDTQEFKTLSLQGPPSIAENTQVNSQSLHEVLKEALKQQAQNTKHAGVLLGGFDSALVASMLVKMGIKVSTYSFSYENSHFNQPFTEELASLLGIQHHWIKIEPDSIRDGIQDYAHHCDHPVLWCGYVIQTQQVVNAMLSNGIDTVFSGDGCDATFMGYPSTHRRGATYQKLPQIPKFLTQNLTKLLGKSSFEYIAGHVARVVLSLLHAMSYPSHERPFRSFQIFDDTSLQKLSAQTNWAETISGEHLHELDIKYENESFFKKTYIGKSLISPNRQKLVGSSNLAGIAVYSPYMHPAVKAFASSIPEHLLRAKNEANLKEGKRLLMDMAEEYRLLPLHIIRQKKLAAVISPIDQWLASELKEFAKIHLRLLPFPTNKRYINSLVNDLPIEKIYKDHFSQDYVVSLALSMLLTYASFFKN